MAVPAAKATASWRVAGSEPLNPFGPSGEKGAFFPHAKDGIGALPLFA